MDVVSLDQRQVQVPVGAIQLDTFLAIPSQPRGAVVFAHGSGSSRHSPRNQFVAQALNERHFASVLVDLLTPEEESVDELTGGRLRFDIGLLAGRLIGATDWLLQNPDTERLHIGYFGASTGAPAALAAAAARPNRVRAIVSRGGRPDLAGAALSRVRAPTLLIVGGADYTVLRLNREALRRLRAESSLVAIPDASHLFEEPGALEEVARLAGDWFDRHVSSESDKGE